MIKIKVVEDTSPITFIDNNGITFTYIPLPDFAGSCRIKYLCNDIEIPIKEYAN